MTAVKKQNTGLWSPIVSVVSHVNWCGSYGKYYSGSSKFRNEIAIEANTLLLWIYAELFTYACF